MMTLLVNGESVQVPAGATVHDLLQQLGFGEKPVVVEHNRQALFPREHREKVLSEADVVEIIQITAGG